MKKRELTIIIPTASNGIGSPIIQSFQDSGAAKFIYVQFVMLINSRNVDHNINSHIVKNDSHEIIYIANDRYFGSCEENIYRSQDFCDLFKSHVFCIGDHDWLDWSGLLEALDFFESEHLDAMGWDILSKQLRSDNSYTSLQAIPPIKIGSCANQYVNILLSQETLPSPLAYPALISTYGPIDWAAYLGNHLYKKEVFNKILQYKSSEFVYSFVYKQIQFFTANQLRYGFYPSPVIHRLSNDFLKLRNQTLDDKPTWLEEHRLVHGASKTFWIANLQHLIELNDDTLFDLVCNSLCVSHTPIEGEEIDYFCQSFLLHIFKWAENSLNFKLVGRSFYLPTEIGSGSLTEIGYIAKFFKRLIQNLRKNKTYGNSNQLLISKLIEIVSLLDHHLSFNSNSNMLVGYAENHVKQLASLISSDDLAYWNDSSFINYAE